MPRPIVTFRRAARRRPPAAIAAAVTVAACASAPRATPAHTAESPAAVAFPFGAEGRTDSVAPGVAHAQFGVRETADHGRWAVHVLRTAPSAACVASVKAGGAAVGRAPTSALAVRLATRDSVRPVVVLGAVNADFFSFTPPGVPATADVEDWRVIAGPTRRPVFGVDSAGRPFIGYLVPSAAFVRESGDTLRIGLWNRPGRDATVVFDGDWGLRTDSVPGRLFVRFRPVRLFAEYRGAYRDGGGDPGRYRVVSIDSGSSTPLGPLAYVVAVGPDAPAAERARWAALRPGSVGTFGLGLFPVRPREAVGGFPFLVRRGVIDPAVDTVGDAAFRGANPRTAVGITAGGGVLLVTVDGRQPGHSDGATLRQTAELLRALGAVDALNLDGGGSTTMVVRDGAAGPGPMPRFTIVNRPSDKDGERPVANALAVRACTPR